MIAHVVLLQPKPETTTEQIHRALEHLQELQQKIPGIVEVHAGANLNHTNHQGYTYGFVMHFVDEAHLRNYAPHPDHVVVGAELVSICSHIIDFDLPL